MTGVSEMPDRQPTMGELLLSLSKDKQLMLRMDELHGVCNSFISGTADDRMDPKDFVRNAAQMSRLLEDLKRSNQLIHEYLDQHIVAEQQTRHNLGAYMAGRSDQDGDSGKASVMRQPLELLLAPLTREVAVAQNTSRVTMRQLSQTQTELKNSTERIVLSDVQIANLMRENSRMRDAIDKFCSDDKITRAALKEMAHSSTTADGTLNSTLNGLQQDLREMQSSLKLWQKRAFEGSRHT